MRSETVRPAVEKPRLRAAFSSHADLRETALVAAIAAAAGLLAAIVFTAFPKLDLAVSGAFYAGRKQGFPLSASDSAVQALREAFLNGFTAWYVVVIVCAVLAWRWRAPILNLAPERWIYIGLCSIVGPLLLVNVVLKEAWGRWRPREIVEFGGYELFTTPFDPSGTCLDNCSFVSGEVASMAMLFLALAFATRHWRPIHYGLAVVLGGVEAFIRVSQGGHFLSDALFAIVFMALVAAGLHAAMLADRPGPEPG